MPRSSIVSRIVHDTFAELPRPAPLGTRWWETLPLTFSREHERFSLALRDALENTKNLAVSHGIINMSQKDHLGLDQRSRVMVQVVAGKWKLAGDAQ